jgi:hypothetical protein
MMIFRQSSQVSRRILVFRAHRIESVVHTVPFNMFFQLFLGFGAFHHGQSNRWTHHPLRDLILGQFDDPCHRKIHRYQSQSPSSIFFYE